MIATSTYDENWQLTKCTERLQNGITTEYDYQYDKDGNRSKYVKTVNGEWTECYTYEYNAANQLVSRTNERLWTDNVTYYTYDADGNLISEQTGLFEKTYEYTAENRLAVVKAQGTVLMAALYDGDGNRLFTMDYTGENNDRWDIWIPECGGNADKVDDSARDAMKELAGLVSWRERRDYTITEYVNDVTRENEEVLVELSPRSKVTTAYTYGYNRESADVNGDTQYYLYDGQGNVDRISSEWGRVKETYNYDPYGNLTYGIPDTVNYYGYNGESSNLATGLQYLRARYYNPQTGNFITEDTYAGQISNPLTLNRYDYVSNNPVNYIDPSGHSGILDTLASEAEKLWNGAKEFVSNAVDTAVDFGNKVVDTVTSWFEDKEPNKSKDNGKNKDKDKESDNKVSSNSNEIPKNNTDLTDVIIDAVQMQNEVEQKNAQAQHEAFRAFCDYLGTEEGKKTAIFTGIALLSIFFAGPIGKAAIAYLGIDTGTVGATMVAVGANEAVAMGGYELLESVFDGDSVGRVVTDTLQSGVNGFVMGLPTGIVDYKIDELFGITIKGGSEILKTQKHVEMPVLPEGSQWERNVLNSFAGGNATPITYEGGTTLYRVGGNNGGFWSLNPPPLTEYQWRVDYAIKQEFCNDASTLYKITIPEGSTISGLEGTVGSQGMGLYGGAHQVYIDYREVPEDWIEILPTTWK